MKNPHIQSIRIPPKVIQAIHNFEEAVREDEMKVMGNTYDIPEKEKHYENMSKDLIEILESYLGVNG